VNFLNPTGNLRLTAEKEMVKEMVKEELAQVKTILQFLCCESLKTQLSN